VALEGARGDLRGLPNRRSFALTKTSHCSPPRYNETEEQPRTGTAPVCVWWGGGGGGAGGAYGCHSDEQQVVEHDENAAAKDGYVTVVD